MVDKKTVRQGYDELAETYASERSDDGREADVLDRFLSGLSTPARILDAGCGQGTPVLRRVTERATAVGLDVSGGQLELAAETVPDAALVQGDLTELPMREGTFDAVVAFHSIIHVPLEAHRTVIDEFARVLRPGGRLLLSEGTTEWRGTNPNWLDTDVEMQWEMAGPEATRKQLRAGGFTITDEWNTAGTLAGAEERWSFFSARLEA